MNEPAAKLHKLENAPKPFDTVTIHQDGTYTHAHILNDGTVNFIVDFPPGTNICDIKLDVSFQSTPHVRHESMSQNIMAQTVMAAGGGTIVIGS